MRLQHAIVLAAAIVLAGTDAATSVKPMRAGDDPIRRLLRSETLMDVDGEERWSFSDFFNYLKSWMKPPTNPSSAKVVPIEEDVATSFTKLSKTSTNPSTVTDVPIKDDAATSLKDLDTQLETMRSNSKNVDDLLANHFPTLIGMLAKHNKLYSRKVPTPIAFLRKAYDDKIIMEMLDRAKDTVTANHLRAALIEYWLKDWKHLDKVRLDGGEKWAKEYEKRIDAAIANLKKKLKPDGDEGTQVKIEEDIKRLEELMKPKLDE